MRFWPVFPLRYGVHSTWGAWRRTPEEGGCGVGSHPCQHWGVDLRGAEGDPFFSPEDGQVTHVAEAEDNTVAGTPTPFRGFGPAVVVVKGSETGLYHLLAHARKGKLLVRQGDAVKGGQRLGELAGIRSPHIHWQVQTQPTRAADGWSGITRDPLVWGADYGAQKPGSLPILEIAILLAPFAVGILAGGGQG